MPDIVTLPDGRQLAVYVAEDDDGWDTDIVYQIYDGTWSAVASVSDDVGFSDQAPRLAVRPDGTLTAVWTRIELSEAELAVATLDDVLAAQEIYCARFDGASWSTPLPLSNDTGADGNATVAHGPDGTGMAL